MSSPVKDAVTDMVVAIAAAEAAEEPVIVPY